MFDFPSHFLILVDTTTRENKNQRGSSCLVGQSNSATDILEEIYNGSTDMTRPVAGPCLNPLKVAGRMHTFLLCLLCARLL
ncbi:unnamed protein product [Victoria cruziana]